MACNNATTSARMTSDRADLVPEGSARARALRPCLDMHHDDTHPKSSSTKTQGRGADSVIDALVMGAHVSRVVSSRPSSHSRGR